MQTKQLSFLFAVLSVVVSLVPVESASLSPLFAYTTSKLLLRQPVHLALDYFLLILI